MVLILVPNKGVTIYNRYLRKPKMVSKVLSPSTSNLNKNNCPSQWLGVIFSVTSITANIPETLKYPELLSKSVPLCLLYTLLLLLLFVSFWGLYLVHIFLYFYIIITYNYSFWLRGGPRLPARLRARRRIWRATNRDSDGVDPRRRMGNYSIDKGVIICNMCVGTM